MSKGRKVVKTLEDFYKSRSKIKIGVDHTLLNIVPFLKEKGYKVITFTDMTDKEIHKNLNKQNVAVFFTVRYHSFTKFSNPNYKLIGIAKNIIDKYSAEVLANKLERVLMRIYAQSTFPLFLTIDLIKWF